jgi:hypothetical protein
LVYVCGVMATLLIAGADKHVHLVDEQDHLASSASFRTFLKYKMF